MLPLLHLTMSHCQLTMLSEQSHVPTLLGATHMLPLLHLLTLLSVQQHVPILPGAIHMLPLLHLVTLLNLLPLPVSASAACEQHLAVLVHAIEQRAMSTNAASAAFVDIALCSIACTNAAR